MRRRVWWRHAPPATRSQKTPLVMDGNSPDRIYAAGLGYRLSGRRVLAARGWPVEVRSFGEPATQDAQAASRRSTLTVRSSASGTSAIPADRGELRNSPHDQPQRNLHDGGGDDGRKVAATTVQRANMELWRTLAALALAVLMLEWWWYHRRTA